MLKKICLLLIFWIIFPTLFLAHAEDEKSKDDAVTVVDKIVPKVDETGNIILAAKVINNSKDLLFSVEIVFDILDSRGKTLDSTTVPIIGKQEGILEGGEVGNFEAETRVHISNVGSYNYKINWQTFGKGEENKTQTK